MANKILPEIPTTWLVAVLLVGLVILAIIKIDGWVTAALSMIIGYLTGVKLEQARQ